VGCRDVTLARTFPSLRPYTGPLARLETGDAVVPRLRLLCFCLLVLPLAVIWSAPASADSPLSRRSTWRWATSWRSASAPNPGRLRDTYGSCTTGAVRRADRRARLRRWGSAGVSLDLVNIARDGATSSSFVTEGDSSMRRSACCRKGTVTPPGRRRGPDYHRHRRQ
jgi:hypothetical protein